jgi:hypothetical protein
MPVFTPPGAIWAGRDVTCFFADSYVPLKHDCQLFWAAGGVQILAHKPALTTPTWQVIRKIFQKVRNSSFETAAQQ